MDGISFVLVLFVAVIVVLLAAVLYLLVRIQRNPLDQALMIRESLVDAVTHAGKSMGTVIAANAVRELSLQLESDPELFAKVQTYNAETELAVCVLLGNSIKSDIAGTQNVLSKNREDLAKFGAHYAAECTRLEKQLDHLFTKLHAVGGHIDNVRPLRK